MSETTQTTDPTTTTDEAAKTEPALTAFPTTFVEAVRADLHNAFQYLEQHAEKLEAHEKAALSADLNALKTRIRSLLTRL